ncbi:MAG: universal stress protein [Bacillota bacterium]|nr:universal stress protein [Bacillota bacterium]
MKILACTDGSQWSTKAIDKAAAIAAQLTDSEVTVMHVYEDRYEPSSSFYEVRPLTRGDAARFKKLQDREKAGGEKILSEAGVIFARQGIEARTVLKEGHPADSIIKTAADGGFDMIVLGSRGRGGLQKLFLGSVSNAVVQEAENCMVVVVK